MKVYEIGVYLGLVILTIGMVMLVEPTPEKIIAIGLMTIFSALIKAAIENGDKEK